MIIQLCKLKTIELYTLNRPTLQYINHISRKSQRRKRQILEPQRVRQSTL